MQGCVLRPLYRGDAQKQLRSRETTDERFRSSKPMEWAWLDLNQRPHPYQRWTAKRHAIAHLRRSRRSVNSTRMG
jgi:hypothetical protein